MKKSLLLITLILNILQLSAQKTIEWNKIDDEKNQYDFKYFIKYSVDAYKAVFAIPEVKPFQSLKNQVFIRTYNTDFSKYTQVGIPSESPLLLSVKSFRNYNVIYGSTDAGNNYRKPNKLVITDDQSNVLVNILFPLHGNLSFFKGAPSDMVSYFGSPTIYHSYDSSHLIILNTEAISPGKASLDFTETQFINVYDKDLNLVWKDSVNLSTMYEKGTAVNGIKIDYINNKLYIFATNCASSFQKVENTIRVFEFDKPQSYKTIVKEAFPNPVISFNYMVTKEKNIIISGVNHISTDIANGSDKNELFFINVDLSAMNITPKVKRYKLNKDFCAKYPEYNSLLRDNLTSPLAMFEMSDGLIYCSENSYSVGYSSAGSSTINNFNSITLIKFDLSGNIKWLKMINKDPGCKGSEFSGFCCRAFLIKGEVVIFYYDLEDKIYKETFKKSNAIEPITKFCLASATVDGEGNINKSLVYKVAESQIWIDLTGMTQISDTHFFIPGKGLGMAKKGEYTAFYDYE